MDAPPLRPHPSIEGDEVVLRPTTDADAELLGAWFTRPDVVRYWGGVRLTAEEIAERYLGRRRPAVECFIVETGGAPTGLIQYWVDGERRGGIDLVLLEEHRRRGLGRAAVHAIVRYLVDELRWHEVTVDPDVWNGEGRQFWAAIGFVPVRAVDDDPERPPYTLMRWAPSRQ